MMHPSGHTVVRRLSQTHAVPRRAIPGGWVPMLRLGMKIWSLILFSKPERRTSVVVR